MPEITIELPFPVSQNAIWRSGRGRVFKSDAYKKWESEAWGMWLQQKLKLKTKRIKGPYNLYAVFYPPDNRHRDLGNLEKICSDFCQSVGIIDDDCYCIDLHLVWGGFKSSSCGALLTFNSVALRRSPAPTE